MVQPFRSEIRNTPSQQAIKFFLSDESLGAKVKRHLGHFNEIEVIEITESVGQSRVSKNITIFLKDGVDIAKTKQLIDSNLWWYFEKDLVD